MRRPFVDTLRDVSGGKHIEELDAGMQALVQAVQRTGKGGKITLTVEVTPLKKSSEAVQVKASIAIKEPGFDDAGSIMFPSPEGNLTRSNHNQPDLPGVTLAPPLHREQAAS